MARRSGPTCARSTCSSARSRCASGCSGGPWTSSSGWSPARARPRPLLRDVQENAESYHFYADELLDDANTLLNVQLALASHRTSEVMRVLTVFSVFFLPLTFIVGVYGMNFEYMPELRAALGLPGGAAGDGGGDARHLPLVPPARLAARDDASWCCSWARCSAREPAGCSADAAGAPGVAPGVSPHLLPDPALEWLRRAHGATGVWVAEMDSARGRAPRRACGGRGAALGGRRSWRWTGGWSARAIRSRAGPSGWRAARWCSTPPPASPSACCSRAAPTPAGWRSPRVDLRRLADGVRRRPQIVQLVQAQYPGSLAGIGGERGTQARLPARADARCAGRRRGVRERERAAGRGAHHRIGPRHRGVGTGRSPPAGHHPARRQRSRSGGPRRSGLALLRGRPARRRGGGSAAASERGRGAPDAGGRAHGRRRGALATRRPGADRRGPGGDPGGPRQRRRREW